jgi:glycosyltransferase involved in cell wall biosynthesis
MFAPTLGIVIPCYNEEANLGELVDRCSEIAQRDGIVFYLVNNGSTDGTSKFFAEIVPKSGINLITVPKNKGYGYGIRAGLIELQTDYVGWTHADLQTDPNDLSRALEFINSKPQIDFIKGVRIGRPIVDRFFTLGMSFFVLIVKKRFLFDINGQPTVMRKTLFEEWRKIPDDFSFDLSAFLHAKTSGANIFRFKVIFARRLYGSSSWNTGFKSRLKLTLRTMKFTLQGSAK